jgi:hypothetical protein
MKDIILKPGTFSIEKKNSHTNKIPGTSLEDYVVNLLKNNTCCTKALVLTKGTVTQATNRSTAVTLNAPAGVITTDSTAIANLGNAAFTVNNSFVKADSTIILSLNSTGLSGYSIHVASESVANGSFVIRIYNATGANLAAVKINFMIV